MSDLGEHDPEEMLPMPNNIKDQFQETELLILKYIAQGLSNQQIADELALSLNTVKWYNKRIFAKLNVKRRTQAVAAASSIGLLKLHNTDNASRLPIPSTPFVGRVTEVTHLLHILGLSDSRLVSIVGPGGIGKTRLALKLAEYLHTQTNRHVFFSPLENVKHPDGVVPAIANAIGFQFGGQHEPQQQLLAVIAETNSLLILDNCEHLLSSAPLFAEMLKVSPGLQILVTSRERLNLRGEKIYHLQGLNYYKELSLSLESDATQLFMQSARRLQHDFDPSDDDWADICHLCQLVDGIPLAIELAVGWLEVIPISEICEKLQVDIGILVTKARDAPTRHRSMQAVFEHSWNLMSESEKNVFKRLCVFRGGFDFSAAEQIAGASHELIKGLLSKSRIVEIYPGRWRLHELLRQYAEEKLRADSDQYRLATLNHCRYYGNFMKQCERILETKLSSFNEYMVKAFQDIDNILSGWQTAIELPLLDQIGNYITMLSFILQGRGLYLFAQNTFQECEYLYAKSLNKVDERDQALVFYQLGWTASILSQTEEAMTYLQRAHQLSEYPTVKETPLVGFIWNALGWVTYLNEQAALAREYILKGIRHSNSINFEFGECNAYFLLTILEFNESNYEIALSFVQKAASIAQRCNFDYLHIWALALLANIQYLVGNHQTALNLWKKVLLYYPNTLLSDPILLVIIGLAMLYFKHESKIQAVEVLALVIYHPQANNTSSKVHALHTLDKFRNNFSKSQLSKIMKKAQDSQLVVSPHLKSNFAVNQTLVNQLIVLLDEFNQDGDEYEEETL